MPSAAEIAVRGVAGAEGVVLALVAGEEPGDAALLADRGEAVAAAGEQLVDVGLVADVPDELVARRVEDVVQGDGELDRAEAGAEVAAVLGDDADQLLRGSRRRAG